MKLGDLALRQGAKYLPWDDRAVEQAAVKENVYATFEGYIASIQSDIIGRSSMMLGAGRETKESQIDYSAGIILHKKPGDFVKKGDQLAQLHTSSAEKLQEAKDILLEAYTVSDLAPEPSPLILAYIDKDGVTKF
jgi:pyrimidine-nucleoside phosphorylase